MFYRLYYIIEKETTQMKISFYSNSNIVNFFLKKTAHAYFEHRIFSKFFGGKICHIWTDVTYRANKFFQKNWAHAYLSVRIKLWPENNKSWISVTKEKREQKNNISVLNSSWISSKQAQNCKKIFSETILKLSRKSK